MREIVLWCLFFGWIAPSGAHTGSPAAAATPADAAVGNAATEAPATPAITAVDSVALTVHDIDRSADFYSKVLEFVPESDREVIGDDYERLFGVFGMRLRVLRLRLGDEHIELMQFLTPRGRPIEADMHANDRAFQHVAIIVSNMKAAYERLRSFKVEHASTAPQRLPDWNVNAAGIEAFYFRDPDGHYLEILAFPADKGAAKWHASDGRLFLGIDHTAIVVTDTDSSLHFYRNLLGLRTVGSSENYGTEQEHLNNVFGARLRITSLRSAEGPGIELLEYLTPRSGRAPPSDTIPADLWYWQINLRTEEPASLERRLREANVQTVSPRTIDARDGALGFRSGVIARDPDGHANLIAHYARSAERGPTIH
jgi:catechol 2,3-dioxygenase-like lactoylglutathione lyase family enzyme